MSARRRFGSDARRLAARAAIVTAFALLAATCGAVDAQDLAAAGARAVSSTADEDILAAASVDGSGRAQTQNPRQPPRQPPPPPPQRPATTTPAREPAIAIRGLAEIGFVAFQATESLKAVYDNSGGVIWGGGVQVAHRRGLFGQVTAYRYAASGERVFVSDGNVFPLGIASDLTVVPFDFTAGWRFVPRPRTTVPARPGQPPRGTPPPAPAPPGTAPPRGSAPAPATAARPSRSRVIPYVGGGVGVIRVTELGEFADSDEDVEVTKTTYHVRGGVEFPLAGRWLGGGVDAGWRWAPDVLTGSGVAEEFNETALDHFFVAFRVTIGR